MQHTDIPTNCNRCGLCADRYVVFGVPMDSLSAGALMPGTAVSQFLELGRLLASQYKEWKPRRTVVLAAWDAFQFGSIGATEYVEVAFQSLYCTGSEHRVVRTYDAVPTMIMTMATNAMLPITTV